MKKAAIVFIALMLIANSGASEGTRISLTNNPSTMGRDRGHLLSLNENQFKPIIRAFGTALDNYAEMDTVDCHLETFGRYIFWGCATEVAVVLSLKLPGSLILIESAYSIIRNGEEIVETNNKGSLIYSEGEEFEMMEENLWNR